MSKIFYICIFRFPFVRHTHVVHTILRKEFIQMSATKNLIMTYEEMIGKDLDDFTDKDFLKIETTDILQNTALPCDPQTIEFFDDIYAGLWYLITTARSTTGIPTSQTSSRRSPLSCPTNTIFSSRPPYFSAGERMLMHTTYAQYLSTSTALTNTFPTWTICK